MSKRSYRPTAEGPKSDSFKGGVFHHGVTEDTEKDYNKGKDIVPVKAVVFTIEDTESTEKTLD